MSRELRYRRRGPGGIIEVVEHAIVMSGEYLEMANRRLAAKALSQFKGRLSALHPEFEDVESDAPWVQGFRRRIHQKTSVFLIWRFHERDECFTLEVGWSLNDRFPEHWAFDPEKNPPPVRGGLIFRIGRFLDPPRDFWWDVTTGTEFHLEAKAAPGVEPGAGLERCIDEAMIVLDRGVKYVQGRAAESPPR